MRYNLSWKRDKLWNSGTSKEKSIGDILFSPQVPPNLSLKEDK